MHKRERQVFVIGLLAFCKVSNKTSPDRVFESGMNGIRNATFDISLANQRPLFSDLLATAYRGGNHIHLATCGVLTLTITSLVVPSPHDNPMIVKPVSGFLI